MIRAMHTIRGLLHRALYAILVLSHRVFGVKHGATLWLYIAAGLLIGVGVLIGLMYAPKRWRKPLAVIITGFCGFVYSVEYFWPGHGPKNENMFTPYVIQPVGNLLMVLGGFALGLGLVNLFFVHGRTIRRALPGWYNSAAFYAGFAAMAFMAFLQYYVKPAHHHHTTFYAQTYDVLFNGVLQRRVLVV